MSKYKVLEAFELAGATPADPMVLQEVGTVIELTDEQATLFAGKVEKVADELPPSSEAGGSPVPSPAGSPTPVPPGTQEAPTRPETPTEVPPTASATPAPTGAPATHTKPGVPIATPAQPKSWAGNHTVGGDNTHKNGSLRESALGKKA